MQPVYVGDVVSAVAVGLGISKPGKMARGKKVRGSIFELGGPDIFTFHELMKITLKAINRRRLLVPVPLAMMSFGAIFTGLLPNPPLTRDQVRLLAVDNVAADGAAGFAELGITPTPVATIIPEYLGSYRPGGQFSRRG
jgi:NADH dehydrogenase